jgi:hypothetical protein
MKKKLILILLIIFSIFLFTFLVLGNNLNWSINGDNVFIDDANVFINANPHTITQDGYVYFNITSKIYSGDVNLIFGFDTEEIKPKSAEYYNPIIINQTKEYICNGYFNYALNPKYFWCYNNASFFNNQTNKSEYNLFLVYEHNFSDVYLQNKSAYWYETKEKYWHDFSGPFDLINYNYMNMTKWYYSNPININTNQNYYFRIYLDKVPNLNENITNKYWFAIKPSIESIQQAISNGHLYSLDPWFDNSWYKKKQINITENSGFTFYNYSALINVTYDSDMQSDFDDLRFVNQDENQEFSYWIKEKSNSNWANVYVKIPQINGSSNVTFYVYYNNSAVSSSSNISEFIISNLSGYWAFDDGVSVVKDSYATNNGTTNADNISGKLASAYNYTYSSSDFSTIPDDNSLEPKDFLSIGGWVYPQGTNYAIIDKSADGNNSYMLRDYDGLVSCNINKGGTGYGCRANTSYSLPLNSWSFVVCTYDSSKIRLYINGSEVGNATYSTAITYNANNLEFGRINAYGGTQYFSGILDEIFVFNKTLSQTEINQMYRNGNGLMLFSPIAPNISFSSEISKITDKPNFTINSPSGSYSNRKVNLNISVNNATSLSYCFYNVTKGASTEISNNNSINYTTNQINDSFVVSSDGDFIFNIWCNDTSSNFNMTNSSFSVSTTSSQSTSGGGGGGSISIIKILTEVKNISFCSIQEEPLKQSWKDWLSSPKSFKKFKIFWKNIWNFSNCLEAGSIIPLNKEEN